MSALAVERPPLFAGHTLVRTPGTGDLHVVIDGTQLPTLPVFHAPTECAPAGGPTAPAVRHYDGPADPARMCTACLSAIHGVPEPAPPAQPAPELLPFDLQSPVYTARPLPTQYRGQIIEWQPWHPAPRISHCDPACDWCGDLGPSLTTIGRQRGQLRRYTAFRCSACEQMNAYEHTGLAELQPIAVYKGQGPRQHSAFQAQA